MAEIKGTNVVAPVVPLDTADVHPTHAAAYGLGGYRTVASDADRDAIPAPRREQGMLVFVTGTGQTWRLGSDLSTWTEQVAGAGSWDDITGKPSTFPPSAHTHAIADTTGLQTALDAAVTRTDAAGTAYAGPLYIQKADGPPAAPAEYTMLEVSDGVDVVAQVKANGAASFFSINRSSMPVATTTQKGAIIVGSGLAVASGTASVTYGTTAGTACEGNDARLSDARTPTAHTHAASDITSGTLAEARLPNLVILHPFLLAGM
jgi:hypothetical protein